MTDHREIWLNCKCSEGHGREWCQDPVFARCEECGAEPVKYIRADLSCLLDKPEAVEGEPVLFVSQQQLASCIGTYLPTRKHREGNFQMPLYAHPPSSSAEIDRLRRELEEARKALEPFADVSGEGDEDFEDDTPVTVKFGRTLDLTLTLGDFRRACAALRAGEEGR